MAAGRHQLHVDLVVDFVAKKEDVCVDEDNVHSTGVIARRARSLASQAGGQIAAVNEHGGRGAHRWVPDKDRAALAGKIPGCGLNVLRKQQGIGCAVMFGDVLRRLPLMLHGTVDEDAVSKIVVVRIRRAGVGDIGQ